MSVAGGSTIAIEAQPLEDDGPGSIIGRPMSRSTEGGRLDELSTA